MKMQEAIEPFVPRAPKHHALFGEGFLQNHFFLDSKWTPSSRVAQYRCMVDLLEKHKALGYAERLRNKRKQAKALIRLKKECSDGRTKLKNALIGDPQRIRNILRKHKELARLYQKMPPHLITDNINQRTFVKRKEQDRLLHKKRQMMKKYESTLLQLSRLQDRVKYENEYVLPDVIAGQAFRMELKNSEIRIRALKTVARAYGKIRQALYQDAIYYVPVLNSLQADINEQANFIKQVIHFGRPAIGEVAILVAEYNVLEEETRKSMRERLATLIAARQKIVSNSSELRKVVRKNSDFEIFPHRYDRETPSMTDLKKDVEEIEQIMKQVKQVTLCARAREVYPRLKKQIRDNQQLKNRLQTAQDEKAFLQDKNERAEVLIESLKYNVTDESIARKHKIKDLKRSITEQKKIYHELVRDVKHRGEISCYLRYSLYQIANTVRHVAEPILSPRREYPNLDLKLPLLTFSAFQAKAYPPRPLEHNLEKLLEGIRERIHLVMNSYVRKKADIDLNETTRDYHKAYLRSLLLTETLEEKSVEAMPLIEEEERGDPSVPTRKQIKAMSEKIVAERLKQQE